MIVTRWIKEVFIGVAFLFYQLEELPEFAHHALGVLRPFEEMLGGSESVFHLVESKVEEEFSFGSSFHFTVVSSVDND